MSENRLMRRINSNIQVTEKMINDLLDQGYEHYSSDGTMLFFKKIEGVEGSGLMEPVARTGNTENPQLTEIRDLLSSIAQRLESVESAIADGVKGISGGLDKVDASITEGIKELGAGIENVKQSIIEGVNEMRVLSETEDEAAEEEKKA